MRIVVILFGLYEPVKTCLAQETALMAFLKAGNLFDMGLVSKQNFNPHMPTRWTPVFGFLSIAISMGEDFSLI